MKLKYIFLSLIVFNCILAFPQVNNSAINKFSKTKGLEHASIGFCLMDKTGKVVSQMNKDKSLTPASILKIITTATALEALGEDFRFETQLTFDPKDSTLIVTGSGDPTLGSEYFESSQFDFLNNWVDKIKENIDFPAIKILVDDSYFGYEGVSSKWLREDMGNYFAAGAYGISVFDNTYKLTIDTQQGGEFDMFSRPAIDGTEPYMPDINFINQLRVTSTPGKNDASILGEPLSQNRLLVGEITKSKKLYTLKGDIPDPGLYLAKTLGSYLSTNYEIKGVGTGINRKNEKEFYTHLSPKLKEIVQLINFRSNNHYSEHLIRRIGRVEKTEITSDPLKAGINYVNQLWEDRGLDTKALFMYDGCGLAPSDAVSPQFMCDILHYMRTKSSEKDAFWESLPQAGKDGTVRNRLKGTRLAGKVRMKSGSIASVQCFAGYATVGKETYSFAIMVNNFTCPRSEVVKAIDALLLEAL